MNRLQKAVMDGEITINMFIDACGCHINKETGKITECLLTKCESCLFRSPFGCREPSIEWLSREVPEPKTERKGCDTCAFVDVEEWEMPCAKCARNCKDYWRSNRIVKEQHAEGGKE